ncbi:MAG: hypothetical protein COB66_07775 [Coxiella sp. (in: Bacteria)]|nr:MAG: hypothetical protein COB66_07775 [Coxiella sp. (in: g-proteobacteria)]
MARACVAGTTLAATGIVELGLTKLLSQEQACSIATFDETAPATLDPAFTTVVPWVILGLQVILVPFYLYERAPSIWKGTDLAKLSQRCISRDQLNALTPKGKAGFSAFVACIVTHYGVAILRNYEGSDFALEADIPVSEYTARCLAPILTVALGLGSLCFNLPVYLSGVATFCANPQWRRVFKWQLVMLGLFMSASMYDYLYRFIQEHGGNPDDFLPLQILVIVAEYFVTVFMSGAILPYIPEVLTILKQRPVFLTLFIVDVVAWAFINERQIYRTTVNIAFHPTVVPANSASLEEVCRVVLEEQPDHLWQRVLIMVLTAAPSLISTVIFALYQLKDVFDIKIAGPDEIELVALNDEHLLDDDGHLSTRQLCCC